MENLSEYISTMVGVFGVICNLILACRHLYAITYLSLSLAFGIPFFLLHVAGFFICANFLLKRIFLHASGSPAIFYVDISQKKAEKYIDRNYRDWPMGGKIFDN